MRTVLVTGPGGAGRTTVAAATALAAARRGQRVLALSTDRADTLGAALGITTGSGTGSGPGSAPVEAAPGLWAARIDSGAHFRRELLSLQDRAGSVLDLLGANRLDGEELTELPGSEQFALLRALRACAGPEAAQTYDVVVVDLPPLPDTLAALALPEQLRRYLRRLLPPERQAARALRPMLAQLAGVPMPAQWLYETAARWDVELAAVQALLDDSETTVRLVAEPGPAGADALRTARTGLALFGLSVDTVAANRVLPQDTPDTWLATLAAQQQKCLTEWAGEWQPAATLREVRHLGRDPRGLDDLAALSDPSALPEGGDGNDLAVEEAGPARDPWPVEDRIADDGVLVWHLPLPGAVKEELGLVRRGDELVLDAGPFRRILTLPSALRRCTVSGAGLTDGVLRVRFTPDPQLWPRRRTASPGDSPDKSRPPGRTSRSDR
ncbi:ArsA family ATPase [Streptomyces sp. ISL-98]|uniref:ArsA family ATPase n=1 Tax=Streptomyces sp. ISL-98 TaxID=2819192 RepID=UPI001BEBA0BF|nr:ArsA-related P-loop ATPase [Streptomyces sp. ISL-98]MBT2504671.1 ArsA family ATPase [Streptomyces sp. ISL-98]